ncbi:hypothetical protein BGZ65_001035 [Modicella reniformis]|uniref:RNI-like protein n=1 Tax=Modicella reniformis TaxID=1440133 RepID=A0A9P6MBX2_9FUNG|nr:hypothetical protein BGZ65_001035 [Modicella reniformis]
MTVTQSFRLLGKSDIENVPCEFIDGENVVFWEDIEQVFPEIKYVKNGDVTVNMMRDCNRNRIVPHCIKHHPGVVLGVVPSSIIKDPPSESLITTSNQPVTNNDRTDVYMDVPAGTLTETTVVDPQVSSSPRNKPVNWAESVVSQSTPEQLPSSSYSSIQEVFKAELPSTQDMSHTTTTAIDQQMISIQEQADVQNPIHPHTTELPETMEDSHIHDEYPVPRLFLALPHRGSQWNFENPLSNKFRLYFLCECGEQTQATKSTDLHDIHLAEHEGYDIIRPSEFFQQYGSYILTILKMFKSGISMDGVAVPAVSRLIGADSSAALQQLAGSIETGINKVIGCIEIVAVSNGEAVGGVTDQTRSNELLTDASLRKLQLYLRNKDGGMVLGDLCRIATGKGSKWVCDDHRRMIFREKDLNKFRNTVRSLGGIFNEIFGRVEVHLESKDKANSFFVRLERAKSVYELKVYLGGALDDKELEGLQGTVRALNVGVLELEFAALFYSPQYDSILDIMRHPSIWSFTFNGIPLDFFTQFNNGYLRDNFPNLRHLAIKSCTLFDHIPGIKSFVAKAPNLSQLVLRTETWEMLTAVYSAITEYQTYPIDFDEPSLRILPPTTKPQQSTGALQDLAHLFRVHGGQVEKFRVSDNGPGDSAMEAFARAVENGSSLKELTIHGVHQELGDECIKNLASIVARSELRKLEVVVQAERRPVRILESIQWKHIRDLSIYTGHNVQMMPVMKALVDGMERVSGIIELECFMLNSNGTLSSTEAELLRGVVTSTSLNHLQLYVSMTLEQVLSVIGSANVSRLQHLSLETRGFASAKAQTILDALQHATELRTLRLRDANITKEQQRQMKVKHLVLLN